MICKCEPRLRAGNWRERTQASNKSLPLAVSAVLIQCGVRSCDLWEPRPTSIAVNSTVPLLDGRDAVPAIASSAANSRKQLLTVPRATCKILWRDLELRCLFSVTNTQIVGRPDEKGILHSS